jgi:TonB family protein
MPDSRPRMSPKGPLTTERRQSPRHPVRPTEYIEIGDRNGGIILDISEGGMAVASAQAMVGNQTLNFRFQLPRSAETIEAFGEINWIGETKKRAGVRFVDLPVAAREQIRNWIDSETSGYSNGDQKTNGSSISSPSPKISQELPRHESVHDELQEEEAGGPYAPNPSINLNPFSSTLSSPLDEPEVDESESDEQEKNTTSPNAEPHPERRAQTRFPMTASTYVQLSDGNGGLMSNLSKTGFSVRTAKTIESDRLPVVRFQLPNASEFVESSAWIVWKSLSKKSVGARFDSLSEEAQSQIAQWIDSQPLPKNASIKNLPSKNRPSAPASANRTSEHSDRISPSLKTPAPETAGPVTPTSPGPLPLPAYISPLAISMNAPSSVAPVDNLSSAPSSAKVSLIVSPTKQAPPSSEKPLAPVPVVIRTPASTKLASVPSAPIAASSQKPPVATQPKPLGLVATSINAQNLASAAAGLPPVVSPPHSNAPGESVPVQPMPDTSKGFKTSWDELAKASAAPFPPAVLPTFNEPDWSVAPKRPTGNWKAAAMIVVIAGTLFGAAALLLGKKTISRSAQEAAQNSPATTNASVATPANDAVATSAATDPAGTSSTPTTPLSSAPASTSGPRSGSSREFYDPSRSTAASNTSAKGDEQFVDEPRPPHAQYSSSPIQSINRSRTADEQHSSSRATPVQSGEPQDQSAEQNSGFPEAVRHVQTAPTPASSNANGETTSAPDSSSPPPPPAASRNQQADANLAVVGVTQNSLSSTRVIASENAPENNSSPRTASSSINPSPAAESATVQASATAATTPNPVPSVSVFSRFRAIRGASDATPPAGSDLQIGRLKSGPVPAYPIEALRQQVQGTVELEVLVGPDGNILTVHLVKGPPELAGVAMGTVRSWQYGPTTLGGHPVQTDQSIYFTFKLAK